MFNKESFKPEVGASEEELEKQREIYKIKTLLELAEDTVNKKFTVANSEVESLKKKVEQARSEGMDLSSIENLDERLGSLIKEAPLAEIEGCLKHAGEFREKEDRESQFALASWYWEIRKKLDEYGDRIDPGDKDRIKDELVNITSELGVKQTKEEVSEPVIIADVRGDLALAEKKIERKYPFVNSDVEKTLKEIENIRASGVDLSSIKDLDERLERLKQEAPLAEIEGCLGDARTGGKLSRQLSYREAINKLKEYQDKIAPDKKKKLEEELTKIAIELGIE